ncbi:MAG: type II toxin-antitoxin system death-on-curing family toxin [Treponema sp.]|jgi:death-on-curing protein|nr:type II toxin-antitoxin system death-on-curing family toxin [Treponema sp.]
MKKLDIETVITMHSELIAQSGGLDGIRDKNMLDASINSPYHTFEGHHLYPTIQAMAAHLAFSLIKNHPFLDGNKRIGILSMLVFLDINGLPVDCTDDELVTLGMGLADSSITETELIEWIISHN